MEITLAPPGYTELLRLQRWLNYQLPTSALFLMWWVAPVRVISFLLTAAALLFTPLMLYTLYRLKKTGWLVGFGVVVGIPLLLRSLVIHDLYAGFVVGILPLITFYVYCFVLRTSVAGWLNEMRWKMLDQHRKPGEPLPESIDGWLS